MYRTLVLAAAAVGLLSVDGRAVAQQQPSTSIVGAWTLNTEKSDQPPGPPQGGDQEGRGRGGDRGGGGRGRGGRGGFGGGFGGGRGGGGFGRGDDRARPNPEEMQRRRDAMRAITEPADRLTITRTESMVIITSGDGRTTRLATDGSKVKDESTGIERKTRWEGDRLISEISGAGRGRMTETYAIDPESHELVISLQMDGANNRDGGSRQVTRRYVYDRQQP